jgi:hypothetical protein
MKWIAKGVLSDAFFDMIPYEDIINRIWNYDPTSFYLLSSVEGIEERIFENRNSDVF